MTAKKHLTRPCAPAPVFPSACCIRRYFLEEGAGENNLRFASSYTFFILLLVTCSKEVQISLFLSQIQTFRTDLGRQSAVRHHYQRHSPPQRHETRQFPLSTPELATFFVAPRVHSAFPVPPLCVSGRWCSAGGHDPLLCGISTCPAALLREPQDLHLCWRTGEIRTPWQSPLL